MVKTDIPGDRTRGRYVVASPGSLFAGRTQTPALRILQRALAALAIL
jgi:hypothetical protein